MTESQWCYCMRKEMGDLIRWPDVLHAMAPTDKDGNVKYLEFLSNYKVGMAKGLGDGDIQHHDLIHSLYHNHTRLRQVFALFDKDNNGVVDREEFTEKCNLINKQIPPEQQINADEIFRIMDLDQSETINMNELFETFRITHQMADCPDKSRKIWRPVKTKLKLVLVSGAQAEEPLKLQALSRK